MGAAAVGVTNEGALGAGVRSRSDGESEHGGTNEGGQAEGGVGVTAVGVTVEGALGAVVRSRSDDESWQVEGGTMCGFAAPVSTQD